MIAQNKKPLILIVDDFPKNIQLLGNILKDQDYELAFAFSGTEVIEFVKNTTPDLILLDVMMPDLDGFTVCRMLKAEADLKDVPVIFLTAKDSREDLIQGFDAGGVDYVTKPFYTEELLARIKTHISLRVTQQNLLKSNRDRSKALIEVQRLSNLLPICAHCKNIRNDQGYWERVEDYLEKHMELKFTHCLCEKCVRKLYPDIADEIIKSSR